MLWLKTGTIYHHAYVKPPEKGRAIKEKMTIRGASRICYAIL